LFEINAGGVMRIFFLSLILLVSISLVSAQKHKFYSTEDGLSRSNVTEIIKDSRGFVWIGTHVGLNRFDGYKFINYYHEINDSNSLSNSNIRKIVEDKNDDLWIATPYGLNKYLFDENRFIRYMHSDDPNSLSNNFINSICLDNNGTLWIATSNGIDKFDEDTNQFTHYNFRIQKDGKPVNVTPFDITQDSRGIFWLSTELDGLVSFVEETNQFEIHNNEATILPKGTSHNEKVFINMYDNSIIIRASNGFFEFDTNTKKFNLSNEFESYVSINDSIQIGIGLQYIDDTGTEWYSIPNKGFMSVVNSRSKFTTFNKNANNIGLPGDKVSAINEDRNGSIWLGTNNGLCKYSPSNKSFTNRNNSDAEIFRSFR
jgi:ligand-binding sensor domain-containing protein